MRLVAIFVFVVGCGSAASIDSGNTSAETDASLFADKKTVKITLTPDRPTIAPGQQLQLTATVTGISDTSVTWQTNQGSIDDSGLFTAPNDEGTYSVTATTVKGNVATVKIVVSSTAPTTSTSTTGSDATIDMSNLPTTCHRAGQSLMRVSIRVDQYIGIQSGRNGLHELVQGAITQYLYNEAPSVIDTAEVQVAMNVSSSTDSAGLPQEIPLSPGTMIEMQGVYIPNSGTSSLDVAVLHFTHSPCGYVTINGQKYE